MSKRRRAGPSWAFTLIALGAAAASLGGMVVQFQRQALTASALGLAALLVVLVFIAGAHTTVRWPSARLGLRGFSLVMGCCTLALLAGQALRLSGPLPLAATPLAFAPLLAGRSLGRRAALLAALLTVGAAAALGLLGRGSGLGLAAGCLLAGLFTPFRPLWGLPVTALAAGLLQAAVVTLGGHTVPLPVGSGPAMSLLWAGSGPAVAGLLAIGLAWPARGLAGTASAWQLARLRSQSHPLQRALRQRAPGTWQHAQNVAALGEAGAQALSADAALIRAAALVHDVGKIAAPGAFVENRGGQVEGDPVLEDSPADAALLLRRHLGDSLRLAVRYRVPREVRDLVGSHHGTQALLGPLERARRSGLDPDPAVFFYPGPLPASREAAILMVADGVEAASRRLDDPSLSALATVVEEVVDRCNSEYQFEDCELTQEELVDLSEALVVWLRRRLHRRLAGGAP